MATQRWVGSTLLMVGTIMGCSYDPSIPEGTIACDPKTAKACPGGLSCIAGFCRTHALDASSAKDAGEHSALDGDLAGEPHGDDASEPDAREGAHGDAGAPFSMDAGGEANATDSERHAEVQLDAPATGNDDAIRGFAPDTKPAPDAEAMPDVPQDATPDRVPHLAPDLEEERDLASSPDISSPADPDVAPDLALLPDANDRTPDLGPDNAPDAAPDTRPDPGPDLAPGPGPDAQADLGPDLGPDALVCPDPCTIGNKRCGSPTSIETCQSVAGCPQFVATETCQGVTTCQASAGYACQCPAGQPSDCAQGSGSYCPSEAQRLVCQLDAQGCWSTSTSSCGTGQYCVGSFPNGQCTDPSALGYATQFSGTTTISAGNLVGIPVTVSSSTTLRKLGFITNASGVSASAGLYTDNGSGPRMLVAANLGFALTAGRTEVAPTWPSATVPLSPGQYWIMFEVNANTTVYQDTAGTGSIVYRYTGHAQGNPLPNPIDATSSANIKPINFYILTTP